MNFYFTCECCDETMDANVQCGSKLLVTFVITMLLVLDVVVLNLYHSLHPPCNHTSRPGDNWVPEPGSKDPHGLINEMETLQEARLDQYGPQSRDFQSEVDTFMDRLVNSLRKPQNPNHIKRSADSDASTSSEAPRFLLDLYDRLDLLRKRDYEYFPHRQSPGAKTKMVSSFVQESPAGTMQLEFDQCQGLRDVSHAQLVLPREYTQLIDSMLLLNHTDNNGTIEIDPIRFDDYLVFDIPLKLVHELFPQITVKLVYNSTARNQSMDSFDMEVSMGLNDNPRKDTVKKPRALLVIYNHFTVELYKELLRSLRRDRGYHRYRDKRESDIPNQYASSDRINGKVQVCRLYPWKLNFTELKIDWIFQPKIMPVNFCKGVCVEPLQKWQWNYAQFKSLARTHGPAGYLPPACCIPVTFGSKSIMYRDENGKTVIDVAYEDAVAKSCGCV